jgi:CubicO group peptidase (beta-lactamase class C family)
MTNHRKGITRRAALAGIGGLAVATQLGDLPGLGKRGVARAQPSSRPYKETIPVKGKADPSLKLFDTAMIKIMERHGIPGAALAIAKDGKLVLAKGYGWSNVAKSEPVGPDTLFGLASLSKSLTAAGILKLVEQGKLGLDDPVLDYLKHIKPARGGRADPRLRTVTIRQCLNHSGGWDRAVHGDPVNWEPQICRAYGVRPPLSPAQFISFAMTLHLNFKPGTDAKYSNVGYIMLGEVIAKVSGQAYDRFVLDNVLKPMGIKQAGLHAFDGKYMAAEAVRYLAGTFIALPALLFPMISATGGWSASVVDMARFLTNLDGSRGEPVLSEKARKLMLEPPPRPLKPRPNGTYFGLGWDSVLVKDKAFGYFKDGSYQGMRTFMKRLPNGLNWVLLYNASFEFDPEDLQIAGNTVQEVRKLVEGIGKLPDIDLFKEYA